MTTVPETLTTILVSQPRFLSQHFDLHLVTSHGIELEQLLVEGVPVHIVPMRRGISFFVDIVSVFRMVWLLLKLQPEIVHSYTPKAGLVSMLAAWLCRVPVRVHTFTGLIWPTTKGLRQQLLKVIDILLCACATHIVPEGNGVLIDIKVGQITSKPLKVIGHGNIAGVDVDFFSPEDPSVKIAAAALMAECGIVGTDFVFVYVGRLNRDKGLQELVKATLQLPDNCRLIVVGGLDNETPIDTQSMHLIESHRRIHWLGFQRDIRPALYASNVLVLPSYREGFPNVLLQAGAMEKPVVATNISGCNEIISHGQNGWLVPTKDVQALAAAMLTARNTSALDLRDMGRAGRVLVLQRFERNEYWCRLLGFYHTLLGSNQSITK